MTEIFLFVVFKTPGCGAERMYYQFSLWNAPYPGLPIFSPYRADSEWDPFLGKTNVKRRRVTDDNTHLSLAYPILSAGFAFWSWLLALGSWFLALVSPMFESNC